MKALHVELADGSSVEVHVLMPGEMFPRFGGNHTLVVQKTPSIIIRDQTSWGTRDTEYYVNDPDVWRYIRKLAAGEFPGSRIVDTNTQTKE